MFLTCDSLIAQLSYSATALQSDAMPPQPAPRQTLRPSMPSAGILNASNSSSTHTRGPSMLGLNPSNSNNNALIQRLNERKAELANLQELKALSATLASQMVLLEEKLRTLSGGAESVAAVLANWGDVLGAVGMASGKLMAGWRWMVEGYVMLMFDRCRDEDEHWSARGGGRRDAAAGDARADSGRRDGCDESEGCWGVMILDWLLWNTICYWTARYALSFTEAVPNASAMLDMHTAKLQSFR